MNALTGTQVREAVRAARDAGSAVGFVPTMGYLHEGHLRLVDEARRRAGYSVLSIFVNPLQFGPSEDLERYPRDLPGDNAKAASRGVDLIFAPSVEEMYGSAHSAGSGVARDGVLIVPQVLHDRWEAAIRPGHFAGVLTVVAKLFNIVQPDVAVFGRKDYEQAVLVKKMIHGLNFDIELVVAPITRESDGLAMSSRNSYLDAAQRAAATALPRALAASWKVFEGGVRDARRVERAGVKVLSSASGIAMQYYSVVHPDSLEPVTTATAGNVILASIRVGGTRLLDNVVLGQPEDRLSG